MTWPRVDGMRSLELGSPGEMRARLNGLVVEGRKRATAGLVEEYEREGEPRAKLSRRGLRWALESIVVGHLTVARVAKGLGVAWDTANDAVLAEGSQPVGSGPDYTPNPDEPDQSAAYTASSKSP